MKLRVLVSSKGNIKEVNLHAEQLVVVGRSPQTASPSGDPGSDISNRRLASRSAGTHINLEDGDASRRHAAFYQCRKGKLRVKDLGSLNGTIVKGRRIRDVELRVGERIEIGSAEIVLLAFIPLLPPPLPSRR